MTTMTVTYYNDLKAAKTAIDALNSDYFVACIPYVDGAGKTRVMLIMKAAS